MFGVGAQPGRTVNTDVGVSPHQHAELSVEGFHAADGFGRGREAIQRRLFLVALFNDCHDWRRKVIRHPL